MDAFIGKWDLKESKNFDAYMEKLGVNAIMRTMGNNTKPSLKFTMNGDTIKFITESLLKTTEITFKLGEEFDETTADGRKSKSVITLEDGKLVHVQKWMGKETSLVREVNGNDLTLTLTMDDVVSTRHYVKGQ
ncbi:hypothetical protein SKAU_G00404450 [Synaphobranchus kaupii]|uniref:Cytosolic fatty-acid binding proteins domain-containing protein n=1 Tax=Synaphobranchus kaupii TaxID=118154 RepID=A0A9Q1E9R4_SYNKA|nr:hypothetical protein SKAU_G00404450 [Synaphobranchus kaupii]